MKPVETKSKFSPTRTCVGCRKKSEKSDFFRLVVDGGNVVVDKTQKSGKRGIYVCKNLSCCKRIVKNKTYSKFFCNNAEEFLKEMESLIGEQ